MARMHAFLEAEDVGEKAVGAHYRGGILSWQKTMRCFCNRFQDISHGANVKEGPVSERHDKNLSPWTVAAGLSRCFRI